MKVLNDSTFVLIVYFHCNRSTNNIYIAATQSISYWWTALFPKNPKQSKKKSMRTYICCARFLWWPIAFFISCGGWQNTPSSIVYGLTHLCCNSRCFRHFPFIKNSCSDYFKFAFFYRHWIALIPFIDIIFFTIRIFAFILFQIYFLSRYTKLQPKCEHTFAILNV